MLEQRGNIRINDDEILLEIENKECKIIATYNREFELQEIEKKDKAHSVIFCNYCIWRDWLFGWRNNCRHYCTYPINLLYHKLLSFRAYL